MSSSSFGQQASVKCKTRVYSGARHNCIILLYHDTLEDYFVIQAEVIFLVIVTSKTNLLWNQNWHEKNVKYVKTLCSQQNGTALCFCKTSQKTWQCDILYKLTPFVHVILCRLAPWTLLKFHTYFLHWILCPDLKKIIHRNIYCPYGQFRPLTQTVNFQG